MFTRKVNFIDERIDRKINDVFDAMTEQNISSEEYTKCLAQLKGLIELRESRTPKPVSPETWATIGSNLIGILLVINHERANVITSKAFSMILKPR